MHTRHDGNLAKFFLLGTYIQSLQAYVYQVFLCMRLILGCQIKSHYNTFHETQQVTNE